MTTHTQLPEFISSPDDAWWAAITATRERASEIFALNGLDVEASRLRPIRLVQVPVPDAYVDECPSWFERRDGGPIAAWEIER